MPLDIRPQVVTALDNVNKNPELYTPPKPTTPLETRINDLKETNPNKYNEFLSILTSSANSGNEKARELLGKIGEDAARQRRGYKGLNKAMYATAIIGAGASAAPSILAAGKGASWLYSQLPKWIRTGIDIGLTVDGARNFFSDNGWKKTKREVAVGNYGKAALSGIGDILDFLGGANLARRIYTNVAPKIYRNIAGVKMFTNISRSKPPIIRPIYHTTTYLGDNFNVVTKGGELGIHVGTDRRAPNYFLNNWSNMKRSGNPVIRTGYFTEYNNRVINTPDLISWNAKTLYDEVLDNTSELHKRIPSRKLKGAHDLYTTALENSIPDNQILTYNKSGMEVLDKLGEYGIDAFRYVNDAENAGNISMAIFNPKRIQWAKEIFTTIPKRQVDSFADFSLLSKFGKTNIPYKFYRKGGKLWKK